MPSGELVLPPLEGHHRNGMTVVFNHAGDVLMSNDWNKSLRLWDVATGRQLLATPSGVQPFGPESFSADDRLLAAEVDHAQVRLLRVAVGRELRILRGSRAPAARGEYGGARQS